ncbi:Unconventional myosin-XV [Saguinus oedipus]|uniref:Unconventional myosin-XV n=1 Tax=Saguinus oedipus TaxID=9490 RepID=A0ABQ9VMS5_SAGOE|nr:Unconventional myosin-XV [Saguinus oedipus]
MNYGFALLESWPGPPHATRGQSAADRRQSRSPGLQVPEPLTLAPATMVEKDEEKKAKKWKKAPEPEKPTLSLKGTSRLFMGFRDRTPKISKKGQFRSPHTSPQKTKRKKKARTMLKSTSKLMTQMRMGKKKRAIKGKKPSFMVIGFPGRRGYGRLRPHARSLNKASTAINWLTKKFLFKKAEEPGSEQATVDAWLRRLGSRLPFPSGAEILRPGVQLRRFPCSRSIYASGEPLGFLPFEDEAPFHHSGFCKSLYGLEGFQDLGEYYDYLRDGEDCYDRQSLHRYEEQEPYVAGLGPYKLARPPYGDHYYGYPPEDHYNYCHPDYYGGPSDPEHTYTYGYSYDYDDYEPLYVPRYHDEYEGEAHPHGCYLDPYAPYDAPYPPYDLPYHTRYDVPYFDAYGVPYMVPYAEGVYGGGDEAIYPPEVPYFYPEELTSALVYPWVPPPIPSPHNPYAHPMDDIAELEEPEDAGGERQGTSFRLPSAAFFEQQGMDKPARSKLSLIRKFHLFPRPQVKLFGKEKLEVPLPPSLDIPLPLGNAGKEEDEEELPQCPPCPMATLSGASSRCASANSRARCLGFGPEFGRPAPRPATSLARFLKKTLSEKKPIPRLRGSRKARAGGPTVREAAYKRFGYKLAGMDPERPSTPIVGRRAQPLAPSGRDKRHPPVTAPAPSSRTLSHWSRLLTPRAPPRPPTAGSPPAPPLSPALSGLLRPASSYGSLRRHPPPWAASALVPPAPQASWWAFLEPPAVSPEGPPDLLAFPGPRPSFRGSHRQGAAFGFPVASTWASRRRAWSPLASPQPSLRSLPGPGYRLPLAPLSPQLPMRAGPYQPPFPTPAHRPHSLQEPPASRRISGRLGPPGSPRSPSPPPVLGHS